VVREVVECVKGKGSKQGERHSPSMRDVPAWIGSKGETEEVEATASTREDIAFEGRVMVDVGGKVSSKSISGFELQ